MADLAVVALVLAALLVAIALRVAARVAPKLGVVEGVLLLRRRHLRRLRLVERLVDRLDVRAHRFQLGGAARALLAVVREQIARDLVMKSEERVVERRW